MKQGRSARVAAKLGMLVVGMLLMAALPAATFEPSTATVELEVSEGSRLADGVDAHSAVARVQGAQGNPLAGVLVTFIVSNGRNDVIHVWTNEQGVAETAVTSAKAGVITVSARVSLFGAGASTQLKFVARQPDLTKSDLMFSVGARIADGIDTHWIRLRLVDERGEPVAGETIDIESDPTVRIVGARITDDDGIVRLDLSSTRAGVHTISVTWNGTHLVTPEMLFRPGPVDANGSTLNLSPDVTRHRGQDFYVLQARLVDDEGNPIAGVTVDFLPSDRLALTSRSAVTDSAGVATITAVGSSNASHTVEAFAQQVEIGSLSTAPASP
ncbi:Ig-like domain-containing protein [Microbacterium sp. NPDC055665]